MELAGNEKKIQALFSGLKSADQQTAPRFATMWNRARIAPRPARAFNPAFVGATALLVCGLVFLVIWSQYWRQDKPATVAVVTPAPVSNPSTNVAASAALDPAPEVRTEETNTRPRVSKKRTIRNELLATNRKLTREAKAITSWQSPTTALMSSPSDEVLGSFPELNQSASDLKSFLPSRSN